MGIIFIVNQDVPPLPYLLDIKVEGGGEEAIMEVEGGRRGGESTTTKL